MPSAIQLLWNVEVSFNSIDACSLQAWVGLYIRKTTPKQMSEEQLKAFIAKVQGDTSLQEQLKAEGADVVAIAKAAGFTIKFYRRPKLSYLGRSISR